MRLLLSVLSYLIVPLNANPPMHTVLERLFGSGHIQDEHKENSYGYVASSMEDLIALCKYEQSQLSYIHSLPKNKAKTSYIRHLDLFSGTDCAEYMAHPVNTFHSLSRISEWLPQLLKLPPKYMHELSNPMKLKSQAALGIVNVQDFHELNITHLARRGLLEDFYSNKVFQAASNLTANEVFFIGKASLQNMDDNEALERNMNWALVALQMAKLEGKTKKELKKYKTFLAVANSTYEDLIKHLNKKE